MVLNRTHTLVALALSVVACGGGEDEPVATGPCDPMVERCVVEHAVSTITVGAGVEEEDTCQSWTLNNEHELWVTGITQQNDGGYHHANWFFVPDNEFDLPDGTWSCSENGFDELGAALLGGYLFALSTQSQEEAQALPEGSAIRIPPYSRVIGSSHLLNATGSDVTTTMRVKLDTLPPSEVKAKLAPARIQYVDLQIDPAATSSFSTDCMFSETYSELVADPFEYEIHYLTGHYHELGSFLELSIIGGERDGEVLMRHEGYGENFGVALDPPVDLAAAGAAGVRFTCGFENPRSEVVRWGIGDQEMCVIAIQARSGFAWDGRVSRDTGQQVGMEGGIIQHEGGCQIAGFPWDFEKPGGPAR